MVTAILTSKCQTTIPKVVRNFLHLHPGDKIDFIIQEEGTVMLRPACLDVTELKGLLKCRHGKKLSIEEMNKAIAESAMGKHK